MAALAQLNGAANATLRKGILAAADSRRVQGLVRRHGMPLGASRFVAGETLDECIPVLRRLNARGSRRTPRCSARACSSRRRPRRSSPRIGEVIARIAAEELRANVALKLTHLGLEIDEELAFENLRSLLEQEASSSSGSTWSSRSSSTRRCASIAGCAKRLDNVGTVLQAYLYRTPDDLDVAARPRAEPAPREGRVSRAGVDRVSRARPTSTRSTHG